MASKHLTHSSQHWAACGGLNNKSLYFFPGLIFWICHVQLHYRRQTNCVFFGICGVALSNVSTFIQHLVGVDLAGVGSAFEPAVVGAKNAIAIGPIDFGGGAVPCVRRVGERGRVGVHVVGVAVHGEGGGGGPVTAHAQQGGVRGGDHRVWVDQGQICYF